MKIKPNLPFALMLFSSLSFAGNEGSGGGDSCKREINRIRENLISWINEPTEPASSLILEEGWTYNDPASSLNYKPAMLGILKERAVTVECFMDPSRIKDADAQAIASKEGVSFRAVSVGGTPTDCINFIDHDTGTAHIQCNYERILFSENVNSDNNFKTIHHEFASLVGVEKKDASAFSDDFVSKQVAAYAGPRTVWMLGPKPRNSSTPLKENLKISGDQPIHISINSSNTMQCANTIKLRDRTTDGYHEPFKQLTDTFSLEVLPSDLPQFTAVVVITDCFAKDKNKPMIQTITVTQGNLTLNVHGNIHYDGHHAADDGYYTGNGLSVIGLLK